MQGGERLRIEAVQVLEAPLGIEAEGLACELKLPHIRLVDGMGGGGSYIAGTRLSDVDFAHPLIGPVVLGVIWAVLFPLLLRLAVRFMEELRDE